MTSPNKTGLKAGEMPEEILTFKVGQEMYFWQEAFPRGSQFRIEHTKYIRADLVEKMKAE